MPFPQRDSNPYLTPHGLVSECPPALGLGSFIIQTVHILQHESSDTGSLPMEDFFKHNTNYFQITLPEWKIFKNVILPVVFLFSEQQPGERVDQGEEY